jgi:hypothetical protein
MRCAWTVGVMLLCAAARSESPGEDFRESAADLLIQQLDKNGDGKLNADECPARWRSSFVRVDADRDGYIDLAELRHRLRQDGQARTRAGKVIAHSLHTVADDFIVDIYQNGERVPDAKRTLLEELHGATAERIDIEVREGDWIVFNVVNNRLRWDGASYFAVTARGPSGIAFTTDLASGKWSCCDEPNQVSAFIADPRFLASNRAQAIAKPWNEGDALMNRVADGWKGQPLWGMTRNTWIKYVAR